MVWVAGVSHHRDRVLVSVTEAYRSLEDPDTPLALPLSLAGVDESGFDMVGEAPVAQTTWERRGVSLRVISISHK